LKCSELKDFDVGRGEREDKCIRNFAKITETVEFWFLSPVMVYLELNY